MTELNYFRDEVIELSKEAGEEAMGYYHRDYSVEEKADESPVTEADMTSERILIEGLKRTGYNILAEETGLIEGERDDVYWIVDPLDGTQDFIDKTGEFSIMVGLLVDGYPEFGVVYAPALGKLWYAARGEGAHLIEDGRRLDLAVADKGSVSDYKLIASRNHFSEKDEEISRRLGIEKITRMGSLGIKFCTIAEARGDLVYYTTDKLGIWDCCAPHVILEEAGGEVFDVEGRSLKYDLEDRRMEKGVVGLGGGPRDAVVSILEESAEELG
ncbi:MAG: 3'(2'),5'-bisphosphate nucleotidase CysQ family protein [Candidatus Bipolaricaulota bacterium]